MDNNNTKNNNNSITLGELLHILWSNIIWIASITVVTTILAIILAVAIIKPTYKSSTSILVNPEKFQSSNSSADVSGGLRATSTVANWIVEDSIINDTLNKLKAENVISKDQYSITTFKKSVEVKSNSSTLFIYVSFTSKDAELAEKALNALIDVGLDKSLDYTTMNGSYAQVTKAEKGIYDGPNKPLYVLIGFFGGFVLSLLVVFLKEVLRNKMKDEDDLENHLHLKVIGVQIKEKNEEIIDINQDGINKNNIESLLMNIDFSNVDAKYKVLEFTSTRESEGKSTTVLQLAKAMSNLKRKCLVIDLDLRRPTQHRLFKKEKNIGVTDYITAKSTKEEIIKKVDDYIDVITSGTKAPNPSLILTSERLKQLVDEIKDQYEYIFLDCPPVYAGSDAKLIASVADTLIYVVAANHTKISMAKRALEDLGNVEVDIMGCAMTMVKRSNAKYKSYYYYYYSDDGSRTKKSKN